jgi:uncharacterized protein (DUF1800 family)
MLCVLMVEQPLPAGAQAVRRGPTAGAAPKIVQMQGDDRVLHALNRLTFGPRPGDVAAVRAMGLDKWFEAQLNPSQIDDSVLEAKLAMFPAMQLSQSELERKYPGPQTLKRLADTNGALPTDPVEHAIYLAGVAQYKVQAERRAEALKADATAGTAMAPGAAGAAMASNSMDGGGDNSMAGGAATPGVPAVPGARQRKRQQATDATSAAGPAPAVAATSAPSDMAGGDMMAGAQMASDATAPLPKSDVMDAPPPAEHVEALYRDLDAIKILDLPPDERFQKIIAMTPKQMQAFRQSLDGAEQAELAQGLSPQQREVLAALQGSNRMVSGELLQSRLMRDIYSDRQLQAVMTDFWLNHFNVYIRKNQNEPYLIPEYVRQTILPHALGKFEDLLVATAESPAMLVYLDNAQSVGPKSDAAQRAPRLAQFAQNPQVKAALKDRGLNENYGRELMELHTLGVNGGYTQADVTNVAKVFTGWSVGQGGYGGGARGGGGFTFNERTHEPGPKVVLGTTIAEGGMNEGLQVLHMLATSPATAKFISAKLAVRFVSDDPPPALVDRMANAFLSSDGDIKVVLRTMFQSPEFWAKSVQRAKVKTPEEFVVSAVRASGATVNNAQGLVQALDKLGMPLYGMQTPNGYSWMSEPWVSTGALVSRMNFALVMAGDKLPGTRTDWSKLMGDAPKVPGAAVGMTAKPVSMDASADMSSLTPTAVPAVDPEVAAKEKKLEILLLGERVSDRTRATVLAQSNDSTAAIEAAKEFQGGRPGGKGAPGGATYDPLLPLANARRPGPGPQNANVDDRQAAVMAGLLLGSPEFQRR